MLIFNKAKLERKARKEEEEAEQQAEPEPEPEPEEISIRTLIKVIQLELPANCDVK